MEFQARSVHPVLLALEHRRVKRLAANTTRNGLELLREIVATMPECVQVVALDGPLLQTNAIDLCMEDAQIWEELRDSPPFGVTINLSDGSRGRVGFTNEFDDGRHELGLQEINALLEQKVSERTRDLEAALVLLQESERNVGTEKRAVEARLRQAQKMEAIGHFTGGVAHDFNNLLMAISGSLELLRKRLPADEHMLSLLDNAMQGASRGAALTRRMLAFSRRQELKYDAVNLVNLLAGMQEQLERTAGAGVTLETRLPLYAPLVRTDASQLATGLINLVQNSRDAMPNGGRITISINSMPVGDGNAAALSPGNYACVSVSDTGHGMDESTVSRLGEPFFTLKAVGKGTGLGLFMVGGLATQSGGNMVARSRVGEGTTIELWLPIAGESAVSAAVPAQVARPAPTPGKLVVLAVDDDKLVLMNIVAMLEDLGHTVIDVESGFDALSTLDDNLNIDLVISDQGMPGMTGSRLAQEIKRRRPRLPVIIATGHTELPGDLDPSLYRLVKPFTQHDLAEAVAASFPVAS